MTRGTRCQIGNKEKIRAQVEGSRKMMKEEKKESPVLDQSVRSARIAW